MWQGPSCSSGGDIDVVGRVRRAPLVDKHFVTKSRGVVDATVQLQVQMKAPASAAGPLAPSTLQRRLAGR
jgi:hypothetical protein